MHDAIGEVEQALLSLGKSSPWDGDLKVSDEFLTPVFRSFFKRLELPNDMEKKNFHVLARHVRPENIAPEVVEVLDRIGELGDR